MKTTFALSLAAMATLASANGVINLFSGSGCTGSVQSGSYSPPNNGDGGCVKGSWASAKQISADSGYIFTVYSDSSCSNDAKAVRPGDCVSGTIHSFTYDHGS
ncbi:hypothetical protein F4803DRAFT_546065 [Xylaria telfairii]|nr:hypothetical protein F4803DRAFT_546065 [Xylaria telfairii]